MAVDCRKVELDGGKSIVVDRATLGMAFKRSRLQGEGLDLLRADEHATPDDYAMRGVYADLVAASRDPHGFDWPIPYDEFVVWEGSLYETRVIPWYNVVLELNPQWYELEDDALGEASDVSETNKE